MSETRGAGDAEDVTARLARAAKAAGCGEFGPLYERLAPALYAWAALRIMGTAGQELDPEDMLQEVWCRAIADFDKYEIDRGGFRVWMFGIANNVLLKALRRHYSRGRSDSRSAGGTPFDLAAVPEEVTSLSRRLGRRDAVRALVAHSETLALEERRLLLHRGLEGQPYDEVGARLEISAATARKRWERLCKRLREELPEGVDLEH